MKRGLLLAGLGLSGAIAAQDAAHAQASPSAYTTGFRYDAAGRQTGVISPDPDGAGALHYAAIRNTYDAAGRLTKVETGELSTWKSELIAPASWGTAFTVLSTVETFYDSASRKTKELVKGSNGAIVSLTQYSYDAAGRLECTAVRMNPAQFGSLPSSACTLDTEGSDGPDRITKNIYDPAGQLLQVRKALNTSLEQNYVTYTYTDNGKQETVTDANGNEAELRYDGHDRQIAWIFPSKTSAGQVASCTIGTVNEVSGITGPSTSRGASDDCEKYWYDRNGNRAKLQKRDGALLTYTFDNLNRVTVKTVPSRTGLASTHTRDVYYAYDLRGLQTKARFDSLAGEGDTTVYDGFGRITSASETMNGQTRQLSYLYDKDSNRTRITHPGAYFTYTYDGLDRLDQIRTSGGSVLVDYAFNNRSSLTTDARYSTMPDRAFSYDSAGRLGGLSIGAAPASYAVEWSFTRNYAGQILTEGRDNDDYAWPGQPDITYNYAANGLNQYTTDGLHDYCYDANGNLTADDGYVYKYDVENRLVEMRVQTSSTCPTDTSGYTGTLKASLRYDPLGRLHEATDNATGATTRFLYDGDALVGEYNTSGTLLRRYLHGNDAGGDDPLIWWEGAALRAVYADARGSVVLVRDSGGATVAINSYDEWGAPETSGNDIATRGRFRYTGQAWLPEIGMYYYKARIYSPKLGRFMQTDPIGYEDQFNLYAYVGNDPINAVDPTGMHKDDFVEHYRAAVARHRARTAKRYSEAFREARARQKNEIVVRADRRQSDAGTGAVVDALAEAASESADPDLKVAGKATKIAEPIIEGMETYSDLGQAGHSEAGKIQGTAAELSSRAIIAGAGSLVGGPPGGIAAAAADDYIGVSEGIGKVAADQAEDLDSQIRQGECLQAASIGIATC